MDTTKLCINGKEYTFSMGENYGQVPYSETLRERLHLTAAKKSCDQGACGCCTVIMNGDAIPSCMLLTADCDGAVITTLEGLVNPETGELAPVQQAFLDYNAFQCGFCTPGIMMSTQALLDKNQTQQKKKLRMH